MYMIWTGLACLNQFINSVAWNSDVINKAPVWCNICMCFTFFCCSLGVAHHSRAASQFMIASAVAIPAASLCINRRLYHIASVQSVTKSRAEKRRDVMIDLAIGLGIPALELVLRECYRRDSGGSLLTRHQTLSFNPILLLLLKRSAVSPSRSTPPRRTRSTQAGLSSLVWYPHLIPVRVLETFYDGALIPFFAVRTIRELAIRRAQFKEFLSTNKNLSSSRYFRLMGLAGVEILFTVPLAAFSIYLNLSSSSMQAYNNWDSAHADYSLIEVLPSAVWQSDALSATSVELSRYSTVLCAVVFFAFFGFADEARRNYRLAYESVAKRVGLSTGSISTTGTWTVNGYVALNLDTRTPSHAPNSTHPDASYSGRSTLPIYITQQSEKKRDSLASFSSRLSLPDIGGALADVKKAPYSPTATSGSMSRESLPRSPVDLDSVPLPTLPEATFDTSAPPRYAPDTPYAV